MADFRSAHCLRPAVARGVLRRRLPVLRRAFRADDELGLAVRADLRQRDRNSDHDRGGLLHLLVETAGQIAAQTDRVNGAGAGRLMAAAQALPRGLPTNRPFDEKPPHAVDQPTCGSRLIWSRLRVPCSANTAPWGSVHRTIQLSPGISSGPSMIWPPPLFTRSAAASMSPILK